MNTKINKFDKDKLIVNAYKLSSWLCWKLPTTVTYGFATLAGDIYYWFAKKQRGYANYNVQIVLGEKTINQQVRQVARQSFRNYAKYMVDFFRQGHLTSQQINAHCTTAGWEHIEAARLAGKGVMLVSPHFGNWDGAAVVATGHGYRVSSVAKDFEPAELNRLVQGARRAQGIQIYSLKDSFRGLFTTLKSGGMVVLLVDSPLQNEGVLVNFFGRTVRLASGPGTLVYKTGAKVVLGYLVRQPGNREFYGCWERALEYELNGEREHDITAISQAIATAIEKLVRRHPDQWYMFRPIFLSEEEAAQQREANRKRERKPKNQENITNSL